MPRKVVMPYKMGSRSGRTVARDLNAIRVYPDRAYRPRRSDFVINWGLGSTPSWDVDVPAVFLNRPEAVANASNKLRTFRILQEAGVAIPEFTTNQIQSAMWLGAGDTVYAREKLTGHSGEGIVTYKGTEEPLNMAPLYVKGIENNGEYRVHVFKGEVLDYQKKRRRIDDEPTQADSDVRNLASGWIFVRGNLRRLERIENIAVQAVEALGLDFGAVDIIKDENGDVFVLEINTACGMSETTRESYNRAFNSLIETHATR